MINIDYECWQDAVDGVFKDFPLSPNPQLIPFSKLSPKEKDYIKSEQFYNKYIKSGAFTHYASTWNISNAYIMKPNGIYRKATNISPIFYLLITAFAKYISKLFVENFGDKYISVFYGGNMEENRYKYKKDYDLFVKKVNNNACCYTHYIKLDISNFFPNMNLNTLFKKIDDYINKTENKIKSRDLSYFKELLKILGNGHFPTITHCTALYYLATIIYLHNFDNDLYEFMENTENIESFEFIRYIDDFYILINFGKNANIDEIIKIIINRANSELLKIDLQLNTQKIKYGMTPEISNTLARSLYDDFVNGIPFKVDDYCTEEQLISFIDNLLNLSQQSIIVHEDYIDLINKTFNTEGIEQSANEVFNSLIYNKSDILQQDTIINKLNEIIKNDNQILKIDPHRLTLFILKTKDDYLIKNMLNRIFDNDKNNKIDVYDIHIALIYLSQRNFKHPDLLNLVKKHDIAIYNYINLFCKNKFIEDYSDEKSIENKFINNILSKDDKLYYLYSLYKIKLLEGDYL